MATSYLKGFEIDEDLYLLRSVEKGDFIKLDGQKISLRSGNAISRHDAYRAEPIESGVPKRLSLITSSIQGVYLGSVTILFSANAQGIRRIKVASKNALIGDGDDAHKRVMTVNAQTQGVTSFTLPVIIGMGTTESEHPWIEVYQDSGADLTFNVSFMYFPLYR